MLINSVKDVTSALGDLMQATKSASGKNMQHPAMHHLKDSAKVLYFTLLWHKLEALISFSKEISQFSDIICMKTIFYLFPCIAIHQWNVELWGVEKRGKYYHVFWGVDNSLYPLSALNCFYYILL